MECIGDLRSPHSWLSPRALADEREPIRVESPYAESVVSSCVAAVEPSVAVEAAEVPSGTSTLQRVILAGMTGLAVLGGGVAHALPAAQPRAQTSQSQPAGETRRVRVFGQDVGGEQQEVPGVQWETYRGTQSGQGYSIEYPEGWRVTRIFNGVAVVDPHDGATMAVFMWHNGQGTMTPDGLIGQVLSDARATDVDYERATHEGPRQTPIGPLYTVEAELTYEGPDGTRLHAEMTSAVANAPNAYVPFWNGNLVAAQTTEAEYDENLPVLRHITNSFQAK